MCQQSSVKYSQTMKNELKPLLFDSLGGKTWKLDFGGLTPPTQKTVHNFQSHFNYLVNRKYTGMIDEGISVLYCKQASLKTKLLSGISNGLLMAHVWSISFHMCEPFRSFDKPLKTSVFNWFKNSNYFWHYDQARYPLPFIVQFSTKTKLTGMQ